MGGEALFSRRSFPMPSSSEEGIEKHNLPPVIWDDVTVRHDVFYDIGEFQDPFLASGHCP